MVAVATQVLHQQDLKAVLQVEVSFAEATDTLHVNVDNVCVLRVKCEKGTEVSIKDVKWESTYVVD